MKTLLIVRHAHSNHGSLLEKDFDRHISPQGNAEAALQAEKIKARIASIDALVTSDAVRAYETCNYFAKALGAQNKVIKMHDLYNAPASVFYDVVSEIADELATIAVFAHNPGITDFVNSLNLEYLSNMPTAGVFAIKIASDKWEDFNTAKKELLFFEKP